MASPCLTILNCRPGVTIVPSIPPLDPNLAALGKGSAALHVGVSGSRRDGHLIGGPISDRIGRKKVICGSILGVPPFRLALPNASLTGTIILSVIIGFALASAFSAIVVFVQSLVPGRLGMISGVLFGLLFGFGGLGAALLGTLAEWTSIEFVYKVCSFFALIGLLTVSLPDTDRGRRSAATTITEQRRTISWLSRPALWARLLTIRTCCPDRGDRSGLRRRRVLLPPLDGSLKGPYYQAQADYQDYDPATNYRDSRLIQAYWPTDAVAGETCLSVP